VDNGDIVARDKNGNYKIDVPVLPPVVVGEDGEEVGMEDIEEGRPNAGPGTAGVNSSAMDTEFGGKDKESMSHPVRSERTWTRLIRIHIF
jgi:hypothetical protein